MGGCDCDYWHSKHRWHCATNYSTAVLPWGEMPYDSKTPAEVVYDYAVVRGDLSAQYARDQLALWIERYAAHLANARAESVEAALAGLWAHIDSLRTEYGTKAANPSARFVRASDVVDNLTITTPARTIPTTATVRAGLAATTAADNKARWNRALKGGA